MSTGTLILDQREAIPGNQYLAYHTRDNLSYVPSGQDDSTLQYTAHTPKTLPNNSFFSKPQVQLAIIPQIRI